MKKALEIYQQERGAERYEFGTVTPQEVIKSFQGGAFDKPLASMYNVIMYGEGYKFDDPKLQKEWPAFLGAVEKHLDGLQKAYDGIYKSLKQAK